MTNETHKYFITISDNGLDIEIDGSPMIIGEALWQLVLQHYQNGTRVEDAAVPIIYLLNKALKFQEQEQQIMKN